MPKSSKEKREKLKQDPEKWKKYLEKDRRRKKKDRKYNQQRMSEVEWLAYRKRENERIRGIRLRKKQEDQTSPSTSQAEAHQSQPDQMNDIPTAYKSAQSKGKAVKRASSSLPSSPRKRRAVAAAVAKEAGLKVVLPLHSSPEKKGRPSLDDSTVKEVQDFFLKDDISWQAPGRKDRVIIRQKDKHGKKVKIELQARYMMMSLSEAYNSFCESRAGMSISLSKFCDLRPRHVKLFDQIPHNVCVCTYHENMRLLLQGLKDVCPALPDSTTTLIQALVCDPSNKLCMTLECPDCKNKINNYTPEDGSALITYKQWQRAEKIEIVGTVEDAFTELKHQLKSFLIHVYVKRKQSASFEKLKAEADGANIVLQVDFAENASLVQQDEIQSGHWCHQQATLFTAYAWIDTDVGESMAIVSDELHHTKLSVHAFMSSIFSHLKSKYPEIQQIDVFSDGASSQFKQRFLFSNLFPWENEFDVKLHWHFFATSHGKGVVDGLGGTIKRSVFRYIRTGKAQGSTPEEFSMVAMARNPGINIMFISSDGVNKNKERLEDYWKEVLSVPQTHKAHHVVAQGPCHVLTSDTSDAVNMSRVRIREDEDKDEDTEGEHDTTDGQNTKEDREDVEEDERMQENEKKEEMEKDEIMEENHEREDMEEDDNKEENQEHEIMDTSDCDDDVALFLSLYLQ